MVLARGVRNASAVVGRETYATPRCVAAALAAGALAGVVLAACTPTPKPRARASPTDAPKEEAAPAPPHATAPPRRDASVVPVAASASPDASARVDSGPLHFLRDGDLVALVPAPSGGFTEHQQALLTTLLEAVPGRFSDGNPALAHHALSRDTCRAGLHGVTLQTAEQREICGNEPNMVPVYTDGDPRSAKACIDIFEFPNRECELPFVWGTPSEAETICQMQDKRLCTQDEWSRACSADPAGGAPRAYAYGDRLDLTICNTNKPHELTPGRGWDCRVSDAKTAWATCATDTEPVGAYPRCKSRLGVYDQHGNVAEMMTREEDGDVFTQLKGSAFFYVDVAREPGKAALHPERESYPDTCAYDPRWHVEKLRDAVHSNYHLGFRCCKTR